MTVRIQRAYGKLVMDIKPKFIIHSDIAVGNVLPKLFPFFTALNCNGCKILPKIRLCRWIGIWVRLGQRIRLRNSGCGFKAGLRAGFCRHFYHCVFCAGIGAFRWKQIRFCGGFSAERNGDICRLRIRSLLRRFRFLQRVLCKAAAVMNMFLQVAGQNPGSIAKSAVPVTFGFFHLADQIPAFIVTAGFHAVGMGALALRDCTGQRLRICGNLHRLEAI